MSLLVDFLLLQTSVQIMKSDEDVRMISAEAPVLFAKVPESLPFLFLPFALLKLLI